MNVLLQYLTFNLCVVLEIVGFLEDSDQRTHPSETFPFKNYYFAYTYISSLNKSGSRVKRNIDSDDCIDFRLNFYVNDYEMCIYNYNVSDNKLVNENTQFLIYRNNSKDVYKLNQFNINFAKGYILTKPYSSSFNGYISNNKLYGKVEVDSKIYYIEPLDNFPSLTIANKTKENALVYEVSFNENIKPYHATTGKHFYERSKREIHDSATVPVKGRVCSLLILIDNSFLRIVGRNNVKVAIITVLHSLDVANAIFRITDFNNDGIPDNIGFVVKYIIVLESEDIGMNLLPKYTQQPIDGKVYLYFLSKYEFLREVCLGIAFTAQPFLYRALGLSYTAVTEPTNLTLPNSGGICERPNQSNFGGSFNNLVLTYRLELEESVPQITSDLSLAHELGHSFGSDHDQGPDCYGYLMSPHTFNGTYDHNFMFSECSKRQISKLLKKKTHCFETTTVPFCGNGLVEADEDCDCGYPFKCIEKDPCCIARHTKGPSCKVNKEAGFQCHPSQGFCCGLNCTYRDISQMDLSCANFERRCPCNKTNRYCHCGIFGKCLKNQCNSLECARIGLQECRCNAQQRRQKCVTCCRGRDGRCHLSKLLTDIFTNGKEENIDILIPYSANSIRAANTNTTKYEEFCVEGKCVILPFRTFNGGSLCLYNGQLGTCNSNFGCSVGTIMQSRFPNFGEQEGVSSCNCKMGSLWNLIYNMLIIISSNRIVI